MALLLLFLVTGSVSLSISANLVDVAINVSDLFCFHFVCCLFVGEIFCCVGGALCVERLFSSGTSSLKSLCCILAFFFFIGVGKPVAAVNLLWLFIAVKKKFSLLISCSGRIRFAVETSQVVWNGANLSAVSIDLQ